MPRSTPLARLLALLLAAWAGAAAAAAPGVDERGSPLHQALGGAMEQLRRGTTPRQLEAEVRTLSPWLDGLDRRHDQGLKGKAEQAVARGDRALLLRTLVRATVQDGQDQLSELRRDEYYGWRDALAAARRVLLRYLLVSPAVREGQAAVDDGVRRRFEALGQLLQRADLTTDPQEIEGAVAALRAALAEVKPPEAPLRASFRLVANPGNPATSLTRDAVSRLFLRKTPAWPDGTPAEPVDQAEASPVHQAFALEVHDRTPQALRSTWNQIIFAGRGVPPPELHSDEEVLAYVREHRGALGYVSAGAPLVGVKVLALGD